VSADKEAIMREIKVSGDTAAVSKLCKDSCYYLPEELLEKLKHLSPPKNLLWAGILTTIVENDRTSKSQRRADLSGYRFD